jgi:CRISPR/Cas system CSM-associated protein Csm3 (group 7 of RAMP superfamily)
VPFLKLLVSLELGSPLHVTGNYFLWGADKASARDSAGRNYIIPATSLKGYLRHRAECLLKSFGVEVCFGPDPAAMCSDPRKACPVCRVFGGPRLSSLLKFSDLYPATGDAAGQIRSGVAFSRYRRAAFSEHLFFTEVVYSVDVRWRGIIKGFFESQDGAGEAAALVQLAGRTGYAFGGGRTRGLGWIKDLQITAYLDSRPFSGAVLESYINRFLERGEER